MQEFLKDHIIYIKHRNSNKFVVSSDIESIRDGFNSYLIKFNNNPKEYTYLKSNIRIYKKNKNIDNILEYFKKCMEVNLKTSFEDDTEEENKTELDFSKYIISAIDNNIKSLNPESALYNYLSNIAPYNIQDSILRIFPFGCNASQKRAVNMALNNSFSIIEGPPGTGKTQTILNIISNIIIRQKTVAIVSNNNSAVENIYEKLKKSKYNAIMATLGNKDNIKDFIKNQDELSYFNTKNKNIKSQEFFDNIISTNLILDKCFDARNNIAILNSKIRDLDLELSHFETEQALDDKTKQYFDKRFIRKLKYKKIVKLKDLVSKIYSQDKISKLDKLKLLLEYGFIDIRKIHKYREVLPKYINYRYYKLYRSKLEIDFKQNDKLLKEFNEAENLDKLVDSSKIIFENIINSIVERKNGYKFNKDYKKDFDKFIECYPIISSSTSSLHSSIPNDFLFDYLIIDESSQVDIIKASICFACARNVIIVGDSMQLEHIVDKYYQKCSKELMKLMNISDSYNYSKLNIISSLKNLYGEKINSTLLKEHYRCHPLIIDYCNKKYYNNELVIMTDADNFPFKIIEIETNPVHNNCNQRQIDETILFINENLYDNLNNIGVISPHKNHAKRLKELLPNSVEADTIHKYQGREKDIIIFNTIKSKINEFIDNPKLINVAISRAVKQFIIIKYDKMELPHNSNIGDLIRYIKYANIDNNKIEEKGKLSSVFDILYKGHEDALNTFMKENNDIEGSISEVIIYKLLVNDILSMKEFSSIDIIREYRLRDLISDISLLTEEEQDFILKGSRLDFLLYNKFDKSPILAIEVDGISFHSNELQVNRDRKKDDILNKIRLPILRLSTNSHSEAEKIINKLKELII